MKCPLCKDEVKELDNPRRAHLLVHKDSNGHVHVHGDLERKDDLSDMIQAVSAETDISLLKKAVDRKEVVFHNRQRIGDILMFTCAIRDFKRAFPDVRVNVVSTAMHIWDHNPYIDRTLKPTNENTIKIGPSWLTNASNRIDWHFANAYRISIEQALGVSVEQGESRPDVWLTEEEYNAKPVFDKPYWIICITGEKGWGCKMYPFEKWQEFVNQNPDVNFVQIGAKEDNPPRLQGDNVVDYVGQTQSKETGIRDLYKLFLNAEGSIGLVSFHMHLSGGLHKPCIVVAGAREPVNFTRYPGHRYLSTDGTMDCATKACWACSLDACKKLIEYPNKEHDQRVPKCVDIIDPEELTHALNMYYRGGILNKEVRSPKPKHFTNITEFRPENVHGYKEPGKPAPDIQKYGNYFNSWGGGAFLLPDWEYIQELVETHKIKNVLEFGPGLSTLLMHDAGLNVTAYETAERWKNRILEKRPNIDIRIWDGKVIREHDIIGKKFDLVFVDGPSGGDNREEAIRYAAQLSDNVLIHDCNGEWEEKWQKKYLAPTFKGHGRNANGRCQLWTKIKKEVSEVGKEEIVPLRASQLKEQAIKFASTLEKTGSLESAYDAANVKTFSGKFIKIVSTARGWGGCARSVTTIMKLLLAQGHRVEFIPFRNAVGSREFSEMLANELSGVKVTNNYDTVKEACDVLFMYADDYVWEFTQPMMADVFGNIGADRKVMMVNYRRGKIGEVEWTRDWDKYMFLNSTQEKDLLMVHPGVRTKVLAPCTDLEPFFNIKPNYNNNLRIVRHSSQGDTKFDANSFPYEINNVLTAREDAEINLLPGPSFVEKGGRIDKFKRTADPNVIAGFLGKGNLFWYSLPAGYMDMGPRVILEAMAAGLPVLADNWGGTRRS
jgi:ADP-heptose:LPS heptosyltransferase